MEHYVIGIDVGTGSTRGALVSRSGKILRTSSETITTWNPSSDFYQQSSNEIWFACCRVVKKLIEDVSPDQIKGIGFDATCSLAVFDGEGNPVSVDVNGNDDQNIILWMDHRAKTEAEIINRTQHPILKYVGGNVSLEMMVPKILWLKRNHAECWTKAAHYFLLPDFLTWRATGKGYRSLCSVVCKCNYKSSPNDDSGWPKDFFDSVDLKELADNNWTKIGSTIINPGELCGRLTPKAAEELGLPTGVPVAASLIDAHAGGLAMMGCTADNISLEFTSRLALISGTSTCHMWQTNEEICVPGVWGPFYNAMLPDLWLLEGGQSAAGQLIDHIVDTHPCVSLIKQTRPNIRVTEYLNDLLFKMAEEQQLDSMDKLTEKVHIWPDFHGNRSPIADPNLRGMVLGLTLATDEKNLAILYLATVQALAYGTKNILNEMERNSNGRKIESILVCGGLSKNEVFLQTHANAIGLPVLVPAELESVLLGSAQLAASVAGFYPTLNEAIRHMAGPAKQITTNSSVTGYHTKKYEVFIELLNCQKKCNQLMMQH